jgi:hypothetical protein
MSNRKAGQCLFAGLRGPDQHLTTRQYARLVSGLSVSTRASTRRIPCGGPRQP